MDVVTLFDHHAAVARRHGLAPVQVMADTRLQGRVWPVICEAVWRQRKAGARPAQIAAYWGLGEACVLAMAQQGQRIVARQETADAGAGHGA